MPAAISEKRERRLVKSEGSRTTRTRALAIGYQLSIAQSLIGNLLLPLFFLHFLRQHLYIKQYSLD